MKKIFLFLLLIVGVVSAAFYAVFSYIFTDESILLMLKQTKPGVVELVGNLKRAIPLVMTNRVGLILLIVLLAVGVIILFSKKEIKKGVLVMAIMIPVILAFCYPTVSRDSFSYLYYAKMVLSNHQNPYQVAPFSNWGSDMWVGFLHNIERTYVYGPVALLVNLIPMGIIGPERFLVNFLAYKVVCLSFFLLGAWLLYKTTKDKRLTLLMWVLNPFIINEMLINGHNDLFMIVFFWLSIYLVQIKRPIWAVLSYALSAGTKYVTVVLLPILFLPKKLQSFLAWASIVAIGGYLFIKGGLPWYYSWFYFCLPYLRMNKGQLASILFFQLALTLGYAGFLEYGLWGTYSSVWVINLVSRTVKLFLPLFLLASAYPLFARWLSSRRSS